MNQEERIEYFMAEIARLSNQVVDLQDERDALSAQVEALRSGLSDLHDIAARCDGWESFPQKALDDAADALEATPQHHLRQVRADAGRAGYLACAEEYGLANTYATTVGVTRNANAYHASILAGKE